MKINSNRIFTFVVGLPLVLCLVLFPQLRSLFILVVVITTIFAGFEVKALFNPIARSYFLKNLETIFLSSFFPITAVISVYSDIEQPVYLLLLVLAIIYIFVRSVIFYRKSDGTRALHSLMSRILLLIYPGLFSYFLIAIVSFEQANIHLTLFLTAIYCSDGFAYLIGKVWGKALNMKLMLQVSPKKTLPGFLAAIFASTLLYSLAPLLFRESLGFGSFLGMGIGIIIGMTGILGDLAESYLKRMLNKKNSGDIIPGRGGVLDSYDSVCFAAPILYIILSLL